MKDGTMLQRHTDLHIKGNIGMYYCGRRLNTVKHTYGPEIRNHYLFVLVNKGNAVMYGKKEITFGEHDLLVMHPGEKIHYKALTGWSISWLGLYGDDVCKYIDLLDISPDNPIIRISLYNELRTVMDKIYDISDDTSFSAKLSVTGLIYEFFSILMKSTSENSRTEIINAALKIIDYNFCEKITVEQIAEHLSVDISHFSRKFTGKTGISPKKYILDKRINREKELLLTTAASVLEISNSVGYDDQFYFSRIFKKHTGFTPTEYRKMAGNI